MSRIRLTRASRGDPFLLLVYYGLMTVLFSVGQILSPTIGVVSMWTFSMIDASTLADGKRQNKVLLQEKLGLTKNPDAPIIFWPSRLDPVQKGCQLVADILYHVVDKYWNQGLQVAFDTPPQSE